MIGGNPIGNQGSGSGSTTPAPRFLNFLDLRLSSPPELTTWPSPYIGTSPEVVHPSVQHFPGGWNGWEYVGAYTPMTSNNEIYENPCIAVSHDGLTWVLPNAGTPNPVYDYVYTDGHNSDTELAVAPDGHTLILLWRWKDRVTGHEGFKYVTTTDGLNFSSPVTLLDTVTTVQACVSPSLNWDKVNSRWEIFAIDIVPATYKLVRWRVNDLTAALGAYTEVTANHPVSGNKWWHPQIRIASATRRVGLISDENATGSLYFMESTDSGDTWQFQPLMLAGAGNNFYRSSFCQQGSSLELFLSIVGITGQAYPLIYKCEAAEGLSLSRNNSMAMLVGASSGPDEFKLCDYCVRADNAGAVGSPTIGPAYAVAAGTWGISSNQIYAPGGGTNVLTSDTAIANHTTRVQFRAGDANDKWLVFRYVDTSNFWRVGVKNNTRSLWLQNVVAGSTVVDIRLGAALALGDTLKVVCLGTLILVYSNEHLIYRGSSTSLRTATKVGLASAGSVNRFKNFMAYAS